MASRDLATVLDDFEEAWQNPSPPSIEEHIRAEPGDSPFSLLTELIKIDLDHRWRRSGAADGPCLEEYVARFPELGSLDELPTDLIRAEYWVRRSWGDRPELAEYLVRFPRQADQLRQALASVDAEISPAVARPPLAVPVAGAAIPITSTFEFLEVLRAVPLLKEGQLTELLRTELQSPFPAPRDLARFLLERDWLTAYQVNQILTGHAGDLLLEQYVILERLGEGATGRVFKARHRRMDRLASIKVIRPELLAKAEVVERFYREIEAAGRLSHPNVVAAYDAGPAGRGHFFAMEYVEGSDLDRLVRHSGPLPISQACEYIRQAASGLGHAHERNLVHRDVKPANLILAQANGLRAADVIKVLDLGLAQIHQAFADSRWGQGLTVDGALLGTPDYLAPEQADDPHHVDLRADIYSLGCTFYYLLTGQVPFPDCSLFQKLLRIQQAEPTPIELLRPDLPPGSVAVVRRMMAKRPEERFPTMAAVLQSLGGEGPTLHSPSPPVAVPVSAGWPQTSTNGPTQKLSRTKRWRLRRAALMVTTLLLIGTAAAVGWRWLRPANRTLAVAANTLPKRTSAKTTEFKPLLDIPVLKGYVGEVARIEMPVYSVAFTPDGRQAVVGGDNEVCVIDLSRQKTVRRLEAGGSIRSVAYSPKGDRIVCGGEANRAWFWEARNDTPIECSPRPLGVVWGVAFAPNGRQLAACGGDGSLRVWDISRPDQPQTLQAAQDRLVLKAVAFCDEGRGVVAAGWLRDEKGPGAIIRRWNLKGELPTEYPRKNDAYWALAVSADQYRLLVGGVAGNPRLLDLNGSGDHEFRIPEGYAIFAVALSSGGDHALTAGERGEVRLWNLTAGKIIHRFKGHTDEVYGVAISPDGRFALSASKDKTLRLWSMPKEVWFPRTPVVNPPR